MLSPELLALLRAWWQDGRRQVVMLPEGWLFPGQNDHHSPADLNRDKACRVGVPAKEATCESFGVQDVYALAEQPLGGGVRDETPPCPFEQLEPEFAFDAFESVAQ